MPGLLKKKLSCAIYRNEIFYDAGVSNNLKTHQRFTKNAQDQIGHLIEWRPVNDKKAPID